DIEGVAMENALEIKDLNKSFGGLHVTRNVNLNVDKGERRLLIGPNGAGKTTLFNLIAGDIHSDSGAVQLFGRKISSLPAFKRVHHGLARTYQILTLFGNDTLVHNVMLSLLGRSSKRWSAWGSFKDDSKLHDEALDVLGTVGLDSMADQPLEHTSYGEKR